MKLFTRNKNKPEIPDPHVRPAPNGKLYYHIKYLGARAMRIEAHGQVVCIERDGTVTHDVQEP